MMLEILKLIADILKSFFTSWPLALCIVVFIFRHSITRLGKEIAAAIPHALAEGRSLDFGLSKEGLSMKVNARQQAEAQKHPPQFERLQEASTSDTNEIQSGAVLPPQKIELPPEIENVGAEYSPIREQQEASIRNHLEILKLTLGNPKTTDVLIRQLAVTKIIGIFEWIYRVIFGSQIFLLKKMNEFGGIERAYIENVYIGVKKQTPQLESYSLDAYINFLVAQGLVQASDTERYTITDLGRMFLKWMINAQVAELKPF